MIHYHKGDVIKNRSKIEIKLTKSKYDAFNKKRNYQILNSVLRFF